MRENYRLCSSLLLYFTALVYGSTTIRDFPRCVQNCIIAQLPRLDSCLYFDIKCHCEHAPEISSAIEDCVQLNCTSQNAKTGYQMISDMCRAAVNMSTNPLLNDEADDGAGNKVCDHSHGMLPAATVAGIVVGSVFFVLAAVAVAALIWRRREKGKGKGWRSEDRIDGKFVDARGDSEHYKERLRRRAAWPGRRSCGVGSQDFMHPVELAGTPGRGRNLPPRPRPTQASDPRTPRRVAQ